MAHVRLSPSFMTWSGLPSTCAGLFAGKDQVEFICGKSVKMIVEETEPQAAGAI